MNFKILKSIIALGCFALVLSCSRDTDFFPEFGTGVNVRIQLDETTPTIDATNIPAATLLLDLYTESTDISTIELFVDYFNLAQDSNYARVLLHTLTPSDFSNGEIQDLTFTTPQIASTVGIDLADMGGGDQVVLVNITTLTDGRVYPDQITVNDSLSISNTTPNILNASATTSFTSTLVVFIACPVAPDYAVGKYLMEQVSGPADPFFGGPTLWATQEVTFTAPSPISRSFEDGSYVTLGGGFEIFFICNKILIPNSGIGIGCGIGITYNTDGEISYSDADDSVFEWALIDNTNSDCGLPPSPIVLRFTKV